MVRADCNGRARGAGLTMLAVLRQRNFALLWLGGLISLAGDWVLITALPFYLYGRTGSALATSAWLMAYLLPAALLGSVAGVFVDRWDRRRTMIACNLARGTLLPLLLVAQVADALWIFYVVAVCQAALGAFFGPAENALLPTLIGEAQLVPANALNVLNNNLARLIGPPLGGVLFGLIGLPGVVLADSASFLIGGALIALVALSPPARPPEIAPTPDARTTWDAVWRGWLGGLGLIRRERLVAIVFAVVGIATFADSMNSALLVPFVDTVLGAGAQSFGWLLTVQALGGLLASTAIGRVERMLSPARLLAFSLIGIGLMSLTLVAFPSLGLALAFSALGGVPAVGYQVGMQTLLQRGVADAYRGRIFGALDTTNALLRLGGLGLAGGLGDVIGILPTLWVMGGLRVLAGVVALLAVPLSASPAGAPSPTPRAE